MTPPTEAEVAAMTGLASGILEARVDPYRRRHRKLAGVLQTGCGPVDREQQDSSP